MSKPTSFHCRGEGGKGSLKDEWSKDGFKGWGWGEDGELTSLTCTALSWHDRERLGAVAENADDAAA